MNQYLPYDDTDVRIIKDFKAAVITISYEVKVNILKMNRKKDRHSQQRNENYILKRNFRIAKYNI